MPKKKLRFISFVLALAIALSNAQYIRAGEQETLSLNVTTPFRSDVTFEAGGASNVKSTSYRIPSMVTLADGTIVAAADIRWNTTYDGGGLDTLVARSEDGGVTWEYTAANYLGDNGNSYSGSSTAFIDPCLTVAADGKTVYMLVDLYPYGIALNGSKEDVPSKTVGFTSAGYLKLSGNDHSSYSYYLKDGKIYDSSDNVVSGYTVDEYFNLYYDGTLQSNLFYSNSDYKVVRTGFLYLTSSTDGGKTWSAPTLLDLKTSSENVCLVGPGRGLTMSDGTMVFPVYSYGGSTESQRMGFIYSKDGVNWERAQSSVSWSSEAAVVQIGDDTLRFFYRNGTGYLCYIDYDMSDKAWGSSTAGKTSIRVNSNTQLSAITYSKTSDGKQVVLVSCPTGPNAAGSDNNNGAYRLNGRIFAGIVQSDGTMTWKEVINVSGTTAPNADSSAPYTEEEGFFAYSCLTERADGSIMILYENRENAWGTGSSCYYAMNMKAYSASSLGITLDEESDEPDTPDTPDEPDESILLGVGESSDEITVSANTNVGVAGTYTTSDGAVQYTIAHVAQPGGAITTKVTSLNADDQIIIGSGGTYLVVNGTTISATTDPTKATVWTVGTKNGGYFSLKSGSYYLCPRASYSSYSLTMSQYTSYNHWSYDDSRGFYYGSYYLICSNNAWSVARNASSTTTFAYTYSQAEPEYSTTVTFKGLAMTEGTDVTIGDTTYRVVVKAQELQTSLTVLTGGSATMDPVADLGLSGSGYSVVYTEVSNENDVVTLNGSQLLAGGEVGTAVVLATVTNSDGVIVATVTYEISVSDVVITDHKSIYVPVNGTATMSGLTGDYYTKLFDETIATYSVNQSGTITFTGVADGKTALVVGSTQIDVYVNPENFGSGADTTKNITIDIVNIENCTVYYAINGGTLHKVEGEGILIDQSYTDGINIMFFAAPDAGYVLTTMSAPGSYGQYYSLVGGERDDKSDTNAWPFKDPDQTEITGNDDWAVVNGSTHGYRWGLLQGNFDIDGLRDLFTRAGEVYATGTTNFTKNDDNGHFSATLEFVAEKLPILEKEIVSVNGQPYQEGEVLEFGDKVTYRFSVTSYTSSLVTYASVLLRDDAIGMTRDVTEDIVAPGTYSYEYDYIINENDLEMYTGGTFVNEALLTYHYQSEYDKGASAYSDKSSVSCQINGMVYYIWKADLPAGITGDSIKYPLPMTEAVNYGANFTVQSYTGETEYVVTQNGIQIGQWVFRGWQYNGEDVSAGSQMKMTANSSAEFVGIWEYTPYATYTVTYQWSNAPAGAVLPTDTNGYYAGQAYPVDPSYPQGAQIDDGILIWTFSGWKKDGVLVAGEQVMGEENVVLVGVWMAESKYVSLTIRVADYAQYADIDPQQTFLFHITGENVDLIVAAHGSQTITVMGLEAGETYTVTAISEWSWRYSFSGWSFTTDGNTDGSGASGTAAVTLGESGNELVFTCQRDSAYWLDGNSWCNNIFK